MKVFWILVASVLLAIVTLEGQDNAYLTTTDSDPAATRVLEQMERKLSKHRAVSVHFSMTMTYPGEEPLNYEGTIQQQQDRFFIDAGQVQIISDGRSRWVYDREANEVNLYDNETSDGPQTPLEMLQIYKEGDYIYRISDQGEEDGIAVQYIEFKPVDKGSEIAKVRLTVKEKDQTPVRLELFEKGGARTDLKVHGIEGIAVLPDTHFTFDASSHPGVRIEDLRID